MDIEELNTERLILKEIKDIYEGGGFKDRQVITFLLQELEKVQRENERLIVSLQELANSTNDQSRARIPEA